MTDLNRIEEEAELERNELRARLDDLGNSLEPATLVSRAANALVGNTGDVAGKASALARENPAPLALAGIGLGWMLINAASGSQPDRSRRAPPAPRKPPVAYDTRTAPKAPGFRYAAPEPEEFETRLEAASDADPGRFGTETLTGEDPMSYSHTNPHPAYAAPEYRPQRSYGSSDSLRARVEDGLNDLPTAARVKIREARLAAIDAQARVEAHARRATRAARSAAQENPLLVGALAFAAGAAIASALPRTSAENRTIGAHRDRLFDEAERMFRAEIANVRRQAEEVVATGQAKAKDAIGDAAENVSDAVSSAKTGKAHNDVARRN